MCPRPRKAHPVVPDNLETEASAAAPAGGAAQGRSCPPAEPGPGRVSLDLTRRDLLKGSLALSMLGAGASRLAAQQPLATSPAAGAKKHVAVVGAGAFGGWTALHLLRAGARVTLIDAWGPGNSRASSGGETRVIRGMYGPDRIYTQWVARSFEQWKEAGRSWGRGLYRRTGALWMFSVDDGYARAALPLMQEAGLQARELGLDEARKRFPAIQFEGVRSVFHEEEAGYLLARRACQAVAEAFVGEGGDYRQRSVQPGPIVSGSLQQLRLSDGAALTADAYVFACGPWLGQVFAEAVGARIQPTRQEVYYFGAPAGDPRFLEEQMPVWVDLGERILYGIPGCEHRGFKVADDTRGEPFDPTSGERVPSPAGLEAARAFLARRFPALAGAPLLESRVCQYENSPDGHFLIDRHPGASNAWIVGGGSGHGFKLGPALGEHVAGLVLGDGEADPKFALRRLEGSDQPRKTQLENH